VGRRPDARPCAGGRPSIPCRRPFPLPPQQPSPKPPGPPRPPEMIPFAPRGWPMRSRRTSGTSSSGEIRIASSTAKRGCVSRIRTAGGAKTACATCFGRWPLPTCKTSLAASGVPNPSRRHEQGSRVQSRSGVGLWCGLNAAQPKERGQRRRVQPDRYRSSRGSHIRGSCMQLANRQADDSRRPSGLRPGACNHICAAFSSLRRFANRPSCRSGVRCARSQS